MNPNNEVTPSFQLPPPVEQPPGANPPVEGAPKGAEQAAAPEQAQTASAPMPAAIPLPTPPPLLPAAQISDDSSHAVQDNPLQADDGDLIEKEWVTKAKQIVDQNREDPYKQSEELTVFKADYMKKRYNKTIKLNK